MIVKVLAADRLQYIRRTSAVRPQTAVKENRVRAEKQVREQNDMKIYACPGWTANGINYPVGIRKEVFGDSATLQQSLYGIQSELHI